MKTIALLAFITSLPLWGVADEPVATSSPSRLVLEITVGVCEPALLERLPKTTSGRLSREDLAQHHPSSPILTQQIHLPEKGRLTQELKCDELTIHLDLEYRYQHELSAATQKPDWVYGGVSSSYAFDMGLLRPSHWNCFAVELGQPLYLGYVKTNRSTYLVIGRFQLADASSQKEE